MPKVLIALILLAALAASCGKNVSKNSHKLKKNSISNVPKEADFAASVDSLLNSGKLSIFPPNIHETLDEFDFEALKKDLEDPAVLKQTYDNFLMNYKKYPELPFASSEDFDFDFGVRMNVFKENILSIVLHNLKVKDGKLGYQKGINKFSDLTEEELIEGYTGYSPPSSFNTTNTIISHPAAPLSQKPNANVYNEDEEEYIDEVNWFMDGHVTPVKNQGRCGSCTLFAVAGAIESAYHRKYHVKLDLSEQELLDCLKGSFGYNGCAGNHPVAPFMYIHQHGLGLEQDYPYIGSDHAHCRHQPQTSHAMGVYWEDVEICNKGEEAVAHAVKEHGPVTTAFAVSNDFFPYKKGVFESEDCRSLRLNHLMLIVGYGRTKNSQVDYWIVKNSWGAEWGMEGFGRIRRNHGHMCGIGINSAFATYNQLDN